MNQDIDKRKAELSTAIFPTLDYKI